MDATAECMLVCLCDRSCVMTWQWWMRGQREECHELCPSRWHSHERSGSEDARPSKWGWAYVSVCRHSVICPASEWARAFVNACLSHLTSILMRWSMCESVATSRPFHLSQNQGESLQPVNYLTTFKDEWTISSLPLKSETVFAVSDPFHTHSVEGWGW